ncbi:predicted protein [Naegleria gruberi]|uniref:ATP-dependent RNA helicase n=1 Tax=Naegleria gruberi TaxID=5762 RepID=D2V2E2_NAEGR|nr:uncharacterized protein NAEGRDRAFT_46148 [Naegleria gruberi]EFC49042.1 predicted protein [Naegleria gruberi]|eukprot:XP_002681786.1 predicted protein [Naegleria gruberi strain NEG-M]
MSDSTSFEDLNVSENLLKGIYCYGFEMMLPSQIAILKSFESTKSCTLVQWIAGSGKTIGLIIKVLKHVDFSKKDDQLQGLVLVPNEFLAYQVRSAMLALADFIQEAKISSDWRENPRILITTPELAIKKNRINFTSLEILAIDEMDIMLEIGCGRRKCIKSIFNQLPKGCEILGTGLRMLPKECYMYDDYLKDSLIITFDQREKQLGDNIYENFVYCPKMDQKLSLLQSIQNGTVSTVLFCNTYSRAEQFHVILKDSIFPSLLVVPQCGKLHQLYYESLYLIGTHDDWYGIDMQWCELVVHFDVICDKAISRMRSGRCRRRGKALYLPSTLEELDFVCELLYGSPNCKYHRIMLKNSKYYDVCINFEMDLKN